MEALHCQHAGRTTPLPSDNTDIGGVEQQLVTLLSAHEFTRITYPSTDACSD